MGFPPNLARADPDLGRRHLLDDRREGARASSASPRATSTRACARRSGRRASGRSGSPRHRPATPRPRVNAPAGALAGQHHHALAPDRPASRRGRPRSDARRARTRRRRAPRCGAARARRRRRSRGRSSSSSIRSCMPSGWRARAARRPWSAQNTPSGLVSNTRLRGRRPRRPRPSRVPVGGAYGGQVRGPAGLVEPPRLLRAASRRRRRAGAAPRRTARPAPRPAAASGAPTATTTSPSDAQLGGHLVRPRRARRRVALQPDRRLGGAHLLEHRRAGAASPDRHDAAVAHSAPQARAQALDRLGQALVGHGQRDAEEALAVRAVRAARATTTTPDSSSTSSQ